MNVVDRRIYYEWVMTPLNRQQQRAAILYAKGYNHQEIADIFGVSRVAITRLFMRMCKKVRKYADPPAIY